MSDTRCKVNLPGELSRFADFASLRDVSLQETQKKGEQWLYCAQCQTKIAQTAHRLPINGQEIYTFANPHGYVFLIGCFHSASNCSGVGPISKAFSWFPGTAWQMLHCNLCHCHLGWLYRHNDGSHFYGLILARLTENPSP
ncbi:MAG: hypothetical protein HQM06_12325 [Magnetococcales bacterium]|nr:hypothetical protein [Magnetococcales bacterium]